ELLFEIGANARRLASEFPEALAWLKAYRAGPKIPGSFVIFSFLPQMIWLDTALRRAHNGIFHLRPIANEADKSPIRETIHERAEGQGLRRGWLARRAKRGWAAAAPARGE